MAVLNRFYCTVSCARTQHRASKVKHSSGIDNEILACEFVTQSCLKPQNPCSNHRFTCCLNMAFTLKSLNLALICMHDITLESAAAVTDYFADAFVRENVARVYMRLWRRNDVQSLTPFCFEKSSERKGIFNV